MNRKSFEEGIILALVSPPLPHVVKKQPIAYSYNGVILPPLPEWDRERYPFAHIEDISNGKALSVSLVCTDKPLGFNGSTSSPMYVSNPKERFEYIKYDLVDNGENVADAIPEEESGAEGIIGVPSWVVWANYDFMGWNTNTVLVAASEPVPVYE